MTSTDRAVEIRAELFATRVDPARREALTAEYRALTGSEVYRPPAR